MSIQVGDNIPAGTLAHMTSDGIAQISSEELCSGKKVVLFSVPGAFTPTCSAQHLPGFAEHHSAFAAKGVDTVACLAVNDAFVMGAWGQAQNVPEGLLMLADGNGTFTESLGLSLDATGFGMGHRGQRFALVVDDGKVTHVAVEAPGEFKVSAAEAVLAAL